MSDLFVDTFDEGGVVVPGPYFGSAGSTRFHDHHVGVRGDLTWPTRAAALAAGRAPCGVCKP